MHEPEVGDEHVGVDDDGEPLGRRSAAGGGADLGTGQHTPWGGLAWMAVGRRCASVSETGDLPWWFHGMSSLEPCR